MKRLAYLQKPCNAISAPNMEADSCEVIKIDPVVGRNPLLQRGVIDKGDCGVDKIPLVKATALLVHEASKYSLSVKRLSSFPLVFLETKIDRNLG